MIVSALKVASPNGFIAHDNGYVGRASDCYVDLVAHKALNNQFDNIVANGNVVQCGQIGGIGERYDIHRRTWLRRRRCIGHVRCRRISDGGLHQSRSGPLQRWMEQLRERPSRGTGQRRQATLSVAGPTTSPLWPCMPPRTRPFVVPASQGSRTPWGDFTNGDNLNDGYHRVWGRDLYQQATGLIAAGDSGQALRMAQFLWNRQFISISTPGGGTTYPRRLVPTL